MAFYIAINYYFLRVVEFSFPRARSAGTVIAAGADWLQADSNIAQFLQLYENMKQLKSVNKHAVTTGSAIIKSAHYFSHPISTHESSCVAWLVA